MWNYYNDMVVFITGGTGFLGTALVYRLLTQTSVRHIYLLCRGDISKVQAKWQESLVTELVEEMQRTNRFTVMNGDILSVNMGLSQKDLEILQKQVNIVIHCASSINLSKPLNGLSKVIVGASDMIANFALICKELDRFVYVSTAYANCYIRQFTEGIETKISEDIYDPNFDSGVIDEWAAVLESGSSVPYRKHDFPWAYAYAKNLTERLLLHRFTGIGSQHRLLIIRPSIIGPAQNFPFAGFNVPMSSPSTMLAAGFALSLGRTVTVATNIPDKASEIYYDEVPVDVVVDRLLAHLAMGTTGCVHAVSGKRAPLRLTDWWQSVARLRRLPWELRLNLRELDWKSHKQHALARLYVLMGSSFLFSDQKTIELSEHPSVQECETLQLFTNINLAGQLITRQEDVYSVIENISNKSMVIWLIKILFYGDMRQKEARKSRL
ncbi:male sterility protein-domain-containing protein [Aspergillus pseudonomiae]|nr:male sterility protein-domain-containing protein [Aspergillus pseudonomiae]